MGVEIIGNTRRFVATPTITAGAYAANDAVGGKLTFTLLEANYPERSTGIIQGVTITDKAGQNAALDLILFQSDFTPTADNAPFDPSDADLLNLAGAIKILSSDYLAFADNSAAIRGALALPFSATTRFLYGQLVARGTPTYASTSDLTVILTVLAD